MKKLLPLLLLALTCHVFAQAVDPMNPCNVPDPKQIRLYNDWVVGSKVACVPTPIGAGTLPTVRYNGAGIHGWSWCPMADGTWGLQQVAVTWDAAKRLTLAADVEAIVKSTDPIATASTILDKNVTSSFADPMMTPVWCPNIKEMYASKPADIPPPPPAPTWVVAPALSGSRPLYSIVNGALVLASGRALNGQSCDCAKGKFVNGTSTYCVPQGQTTLVAYCKPI